MNIQPSNYRNRHISYFCHVMRSQNELQINRIEYLNDSLRDRLVILLESELPLDPEVNAFLKNDHLILEASRSMSYERPLRTHLITEDYLSGRVPERMEIGFSELVLNHDFKYNVVSCQLINPTLLKVILEFKPSTDFN
jgi:hypothetical protein